MVRVTGHTMTQPTLWYAKDIKAKLRGSSWDLINIKFREPMPLNNWACVRIRNDFREDGSIHESPCAETLIAFQDHLKAKGITVTENDDHGDLEIRGNNYKVLGDYFQASRDEYKVRLLLVVLPDKPSAELYSNIKRYGDLTHGIHTVCVKFGKFGTLPYDDNVALVSPIPFLLCMLDWSTGRLANANIPWAASRLPRSVLEANTRSEEEC